MLNTFEIKPNFAYLSRKYDLDPRTIKNTITVMMAKQQLELNHHS